MDTNNESPGSAFAPATGYATRFVYDDESGYVHDASSDEWLTSSSEVYFGMKEEMLQLIARCDEAEAKLADCFAEYSKLESAELGELRKDKARLDWIADKGNGYAALQLPGECVRRNAHSMRAAIDDAMDMQKRESHNEKLSGALKKGEPNV